MAAVRKICFDFQLQRQFDINGVEAVQKFQIILPSRGCLPVQIAP